ncbi:hypothetical protein FXO37_07274 [Capsicum annuum]|nr:hypothetical protein FXO37_07274 [Capsicum annuum]
MSSKDRDSLLTLTAETGMLLMLWVRASEPMVCPEILKNYLSSITETESETVTVGSSHLTNMPQIKQYSYVGVQSVTPIGRVSILRHWLLDSVIQALLCAGIDLSEATISTQINFGNRANQGMTPGPPIAKDNENPTPSGKQHMDHFREASSDEDLEQAQKRLKI